jgi:hypothetical protein
MVHEGSKPVRKAKVEMLEGQLNHFIIYDDKTPHEIQPAKKASQQGKSPRVQEVDQSHVDGKIDDGLYSNEL